MNSPFRASSLLVSLLLLICFASAAQATTTFRAFLKSEQEVPPRQSPASGTGTVILNDAETQITVSLVFGGLTSNQTDAHIHSPAQVGVNAPVRFPIGSQGETTGSFRDRVFDVTPTDVANLKAGLMYFNVHSVNFPGGEIRGQIHPAVVISEFRFRGPNGIQDEYIELFNDSDAPVTVTSSDGSGGWSLVVLDAGGNPSVRVPLPDFNVTIPARGHYLAFNNGGYGLGSYASGDAYFGGDIPDGSAVALFRTRNPSNFNYGYRMDAVGFNVNNPLYREGFGVPLNFGVTQNVEHAVVRKMPSGVTQDIGSNAADFVIVSPLAQTLGNISTGFYFSILGAPGPENTASPVRRNGILSGSLLDTARPEPSPPNRVRDTTPVPNGQFGTISYRLSFTNNTTQPVTRLRFRIVELTTANNRTAAEADLRALTSNDTFVTLTNGSTVLVKGTVLEGPPSQPAGGGLNSSLAVPTITLSQPLQPTEKVNVQFLLGVQQEGTLRFFLKVEALP
ncbi:MAG TPA: CHRD domain-containing protein [Pyrinomonadaceae bacterium]|nr:CHRD domain-containing protein [Pyrinomonadaceae bacterium]